MSNDWKKKKKETFKSDAEVGVHVDGVERRDTNTHTCDFSESSYFSVILLLSQLSNHKVFRSWRVSKPNILNTPRFGWSLRKSYTFDLLRCLCDSLGRSPKLSPFFPFSGASRGRACMLLQHRTGYLSNARPMNHSKPVQSSRIRVTLQQFACSVLSIPHHCISSKTLFSL